MNPFRTLLLAGLLAATGAAPEAVAVICHPHPLQQGTMHNKVATTLARTFAVSVEARPATRFSAFASSCRSIPRI